MAVYLGITSDGTFVTSDGYKLQDTNGLSLNALYATDKYKVILNNVVYNINVNLNKKEAE